MNNAPILIEPYNSEWPKLFELEAASLTEVFRPCLAGAVEHVGSTAVHGLAAKPIIDIMAPVSGLSDSEPAIEALSALSYCFFPYRAEVMHWFCKPSPAHRTHHLHLVPRGSILWVQPIAFRDALRNSAELAAEYQALKQHLAHEYAQDREAYTEAKSPFTQSVLSRVGASAA